MSTPNAASSSRRRTRPLTTTTLKSSLEVTTETSSPQHFAPPPSYTASIDSPNSDYYGDNSLGISHSQSISPTRTAKEESGYNYVQLSDVMMNDDEYRFHSESSFYRHGRYGGRDVRSGVRAQSLVGDESFDVKCADGCWKFSAVAVGFLFLVGYLIETQPLYIKGISTQRVQRTTSSRRMDFGMDDVTMNQEDQSFWRTLDTILEGKDATLEEVQTIVSTSSLKLANMDCYSSLFQPFLNRNDNDVPIRRSLEDEDVVDGTLHTSYDLIPQARVAFQTASFYFLIMVFTYIYAHNAMRIRYSLSSTYVSTILWSGSMMRRFKVSFRSGAKQIRRQRRGYRDIPEHNRGMGVGGSGGLSGASRSGNEHVGIGGASIRVGYSEDRSTGGGGSGDNPVGVAKQISRKIQIAPKVKTPSVTVSKGKKAIPSLSLGGKKTTSEKSGGIMEATSLHDELWKKVHEVTSGSTKKSKKR